MLTISSEGEILASLKAGEPTLFDPSELQFQLRDQQSRYLEFQETSTPESFMHYTMLTTQGKLLMTLSTNAIPTALRSKFVSGYRRNLLIFCGSRI